MRIEVVCLSLLMSTIGCNKPAEDTGVTELETVEIGSAIDAELSTELDEQGRRVAVEVAGVLPGDLPPEVRIYSPSSVVDFGDLDDRHRFVTVDVAAPPDRVRAGVGAQLEGAGWNRVTETKARLDFVQGSRALSVGIEDLASGTRLRYEYEPLG